MRVLKKRNRMEQGVVSKKYESLRFLVLLTTDNEQILKENGTVRNHSLQLIA